eukprot:m.41152 g.41152  ORF g.41152 m.41152 type:complete len:340 (+) comp18713_c0_seq1:76-1095(+)
MMEEENSTAPTPEIEDVGTQNPAENTPAKPKGAPATLEVQSKTNEVDGKAALRKLAEKTQAPNDGLDSVVSSWFSSFTSAVSDAAGSGADMVGKFSDNASIIAGTFAEQSVGMVGKLEHNLENADITKIVNVGKAAGETFGKVSKGMMDSTRLAAESSWTTAVDATTGTFAALNNYDDGDDQVAAMKLMVTTANPEIVDAVRTAMALRFGTSAKVRGEKVSAPCAAQLVGLDSAKSVSKTILELVSLQEGVHSQPTSSNSNTIQAKPDELVLTIQDYIEEITPGVSWMEINLLTLQDVSNGIEIELLSQAIEAPLKHVDAARKKQRPTINFQKAVLLIG